MGSEAGSSGRMGVGGGIDRGGVTQMRDWLKELESVGTDLGRNERAAVAAIGATNTTTAATATTTATFITNATTTAGAKLAAVFEPGHLKDLLDFFTKLELEAGPLH